MVGVLYARVGSSWIPISGSGAGVPAGGVAGDVVIKVSPTNLDVRWGTDPPRLTLTSPTAVTLPLSGHPLQLGTTAGLNVAMDGGGVIQARNNGVASTLTLNPLGGVIQLGSAQPQQVRIGNDAYLTDVNVAHMLAVVSTTDSRYGFLRLGGTAQVVGTDVYMQLVSPSDMYVDFSGSGSCNWRRTSDYTALMTLNAGGGLTAYGLTSNGTINAAGNIVSGGQIYAGTNQWFRVRGNTGIYWEDYGGGWNMSDSTWMRVYNNKGIYTPGEIRGGLVSSEGAMVLGLGQALRFNGPSDFNHYIAWWGGSAAEVHPASGVGSNGPRLVGYATVVLTTVLNGRNWLFEYGGGSAFGAGPWNVFSSRTVKHDIVYLTPDECLDQVKQWKPVEFSPPDSDERRDGFIAEEMYEVTPTITTVSLVPNGDLPAGSPNAIGYGEATVRLSGAVQALLTRVEALEAK